MSKYTVIITTFQVGWDRPGLGLELCLPVVEKSLDSITGPDQIQIWLRRHAISATATAFRRSAVNIADREEANPFCSRLRHQFC